MNWEAVGTVSEIVGALAVVITLVYLAVQIRQNNHSSGLGKKWWDEVGRGIVDPKFAELIDDLLEDTEPDFTYKKMTTWVND